MELILLALFGAIISTLAPLGWSIYKETRYVDTRQVLEYGLAAIVFGLAYSTIPLTKNFEGFRIYGIIFIISYGLLLTYLFFADKSFVVEEKKPSLIVSGKTSGCLQLTLLVPVIITYLNWTLALENLIYFFVVTFIISWIISRLFYLKRN